MQLYRRARVGRAARGAGHDACTQAAEGTSIVADARSELHDVLNKLSRTRDKSARRELRAVQRELRNEIRAREKDVVRHAPVLSRRALQLRSREQVKDNNPERRCRPRDMHGRCEQDACCRFC